MKLKEKVMIVTGAGAGIGEATALLFAREGASVCCNSLSQSAQKVTETIEKSGGKAIFVEGDVSNVEDAKRVVDQTIERFGRLDILFNNAGIVVPGSIDNISVKDWDRTMSVNVRSIYLVSKNALPELRKTEGAIINNASAVAIK